MLRLTPYGSLSWIGEKEKFIELAEAFSHCWCQGLFQLAATRLSVKDVPVLHYWQAVANRFLTGLCHLPEGIHTRVNHLSIEQYDALILQAPLMLGGEYLSRETISSIWDSLNQWVQETIAGKGSLGLFLSEQAPKWQQLGRVCFHLAENKDDEKHPFAFMATYTSGFSASDRVVHLPMRKALEQYAGEQNRSALVKLLTPVQQAAKSCKWVHELVDSGSIYHAKRWSPEQAYQFLTSVPQLEESGLTVRVPNWWKKRTRPAVQVTIGEAKIAHVGVSSLLDFDVTVALGETTLSETEIQDLLAKEERLVFFKGQWVEVDREKLQEALRHWEEIKNSGQISFVEGMRLLAGMPMDIKDSRQSQRLQWVHVNPGQGLKDLLHGLQDSTARFPPEAQDKLSGILRPYQKEGVAWLYFLTQLGLGACLADDMGLGKTIQVLALLLAKKSALPSLLVVPASLLGNWKNEAERFAPSLELFFAHTAETRSALLEEMAHSFASHASRIDLVITTYAMLSRQKWLLDVEWNMVILDEAQVIKNVGTVQTKAVKKIKACSRVALTGTPVENRLGDLWSLFDFLNPGLLGSVQDFKKFVASLQGGSGVGFAPLRRLVRPYILRRMKTNRSIIKDLPDKTEVPCYCTLSQAQVKLYKNSVQVMEEALQKLSGIERRGLVLQTLMRLKQICNHPSQVLGEGAFEASDSGKFLRLGELCEELAERQEKVLIFTQFREIIPPLEDFLTSIFKQGGVVLHGGTSIQKRQQLVAQFQHEDGPPFFILSLKAGGTGLNLTAASHVIHFDRWWNPAVENQATDRAFRIGQQRNVLVHKFVTRGTIEEKIDLMIAQKQQLAAEILTDSEELKLTELTDEELLNLIRLDIHQVGA